MDIAQQINDFVNSTLCGEDEMREAAQKMAANHPTLQQKTMKLVCMFIEEMAAKKYCDARNKPSITKAHMITAADREARIKTLMKEEGHSEEEAAKLYDKYFTLSSNMPLI